MLLDLFFALLIISIGVVGLLVAHAEGKKAGVIEGQNIVWEKVADSIKRQVPLSIRFRGPGISIEKSYDIRERRHIKTQLGQPGGISFSKEPSEDGKSIAAMVVRENRVVMDLTLPLEQVPKGLWGKNLEARVSYHGWSGIGND